MKQAYRTMDDIWNSPWGSLTSGTDAAPKTDRVLRSTRLEDSIYPGSVPRHFPVVLLSYSETE